MLDIKQGIVSMLVDDQFLLSIHNGRQVMRVELQPCQLRWRRAVLSDRPVAPNHATVESFGHGDAPLCANVT